MKVRQLGIITLVMTVLMSVFVALGAIVTGLSMEFVDMIITKRTKRKELRQTEFIKGRANAIDAEYIVRSI